MGTATGVRNILWGNWWRRVLVVVVVLVGLYAALGFLAVPAVLQWQVPKQVAKYTTGTATLGKVRFNPFNFDLQADDFTLRSAQRQTLLHFAHLDINYNPMQFVRRRTDFGWIHLDAPSISASVGRDGKLNFASLLKPSPKPDATKPQEKEETGKLPLVFIDDLQITNGHVAYADQSQGRDFHTALDAINLHLTNLSTEPDTHGEYRLQATIGTDQKLAWHGGLGLNPLRSKGQLDVSGLHLAQFWPYIGNRFKVALTGGTLDVGTQYAMQQGNHGLQLALHDGKIALTGLTLARTGGGDPLVSIPKLDVGGLDFDLARHAVDIASVQSSGGRIRGVLDKQHQLDLVTLLQPTAESAAPAAGSKPSAAAPPMAIKVADVAISDYAVALTDESTAQPTHLSVTGIALQVRGYSSANDKPVDVQADLKVNGGTLHAAGSVALKPLAAQMQFKLANLQLDSFQHYVEPFARIVVKDGVLGADGKLSYRQQDQTADLSFDGDARLARLDVDDARDHQPLVRLGQLSLAGIRYRSDPASVVIHTVTLDKPFGRLIIAPDHSTNISDVLIHESGKSTTPAKPAPAGKGGGIGAMPITIDQIKVQQGAMRFTDYSLKPNVSLGIQHLDGGIDGFTTRPGHTAEIDLHGDVGAFAPISIKGSINPLGKQLTADIAAHLKNLELTSFSPYSGKFAGYQIKKGKVNLDLGYKIHNGLMEGQNSVVIDQLELGERVESPDAVSLPLRLAVALLKNADGVISLDLPVHGDLNDPKFAIGPLIWKVFVNLITKAATAPFRLLAGLVEGGSDELDHVSFAAGQSNLAPTQQKSLTTLAGALAKRPNLNLDISGVAVPTLDAAALGRQRLIARLNGEQHVRRSAEAEETLTAEGEKRLLAEYREQFHVAPDAALPRKPDESKGAWQKRVGQAAFERLAAASPPPPAALERLARARADVVRAYLVNSGHIDPSRLFLITPDPAAKGDGKDTVRMPLQVQVR